MKAMFSKKRSIAALMCSGPGLAFAGPTGGDVVAGAATISTTSPLNTVINQSTHRAAINWQSFSIAGNEHVQFNQPNSNSISLNRVVGGNPSEILGNLSANGQVFLINPRGVYFGQNASLDVGGLVASTLDIGNTDFMNGNFKFLTASTNLPDGSSVVNDGILKAREGGYVVLAGDAVRNNGQVEAKFGTVALAAGGEVTLDIEGDGLVSFSVDGATTAEMAGVTNTGELLADGGRVVLTGNVANDLVSTAVNNEGLVQAKTITEKDGEIFLLGFGGDTVHADGAEINASDDTDTDAGFVEISSNEGLAIRGDVNVGRGGEVLIDPTVLNVVTGGGASNSTAFNAINPSDSSASVNSGFIEGQLNANTSVTLRASNTINVNAGITATTGSGNLSFVSSDGITGAPGTAVTIDLMSNNININGDLNLDAGTGNITGLSNLDARNIDLTATRITGNDFNTNVRATNNGGGNLNITAESFEVARAGTVDINLDATNTLNLNALTSAFNSAAFGRARVTLRGATVNVDKRINASASAGTVAEVVFRGPSGTVNVNADIDASGGTIGRVIFGSGAEGGPDTPIGSVGTTNMSGIGGLVTADHVTINATGSVNVATDASQIILGITSMSAATTATSITVDNTAFTGMGTSAASVIEGRAGYDIGTLDISVGGDLDLFDTFLEGRLTDTNNVTFRAGNLITLKTMSMKPNIFLSTGSASLTLGGIAGDAANTIDLNGANISIRGDLTLEAGSAAAMTGSMGSINALGTLQGRNVTLKAKNILGDANASIIEVLADNGGMGSSDLTITANDFRVETQLSGFLELALDATDVVNLNAPVSIRADAGNPNANIELYLMANTVNINENLEVRGNGNLFAPLVAFDGPGSTVNVNANITVGYDGTAGFGGRVFFGDPIEGDIIASVGTTATQGLVTVTNGTDSGVLFNFTDSVNVRTNTSTVILGATGSGGTPAMPNGATMANSLVIDNTSGTGLDIDVRSASYTFTNADIQTGGNFSTATNLLGNDFIVNNNITLKAANDLLVDGVGVTGFVVLEAGTGGAGTLTVDRDPTEMDNMVPIISGADVSLTAATEITTNTNGFLAISATAAGGDITIDGVFNRNKNGTTKFVAQDMLTFTTAGGTAKGDVNLVDTSKNGKVIFEAKTISVGDVSLNATVGTGTGSPANITTAEIIFKTPIAAGMADSTVTLNGDVVATAKADIDGTTRQLLNGGGRVVFAGFDGGNSAVALDPFKSVISPDPDGAGALLHSGTITGDVVNFNVSDTINVRTQTARINVGIGRTNNLSTTNVTVDNSPFGTSGGRGARLRVDTGSFTGGPSYTINNLNLAFGNRGRIRSDNGETLKLGNATVMAGGNLTLGGASRGADIIPYEILGTGAGTWNFTTTNDGNITGDKLTNIGGDINVTAGGTGTLSLSEANAKSVDLTAGTITTTTGGTFVSASGTGATSGAMLTGNFVRTGNPGTTRFFAANNLVFNDDVMVTDISGDGKVVFEAQNITTATVSLTATTGIASPDAATTAEITYKGVKGQLNPTVTLNGNVTATANLETNPNDSGRFVKGAEVNFVGASSAGDTMGDQPLNPFASVISPDPDGPGGADHSGTIKADVIRFNVKDEINVRTESPRINLGINRTLNARTTNVTIDNTPHTTFDVLVDDGMGGGPVTVTRGARLQVDTGSDAGAAAAYTIDNLDITFGDKGRLRGKDGDDLVLGNATVVTGGNLALGGASLGAPIVPYVITGTGSGVWDFTANASINADATLGDITGDVLNNAGGMITLDAAGELRLNAATAGTVSLTGVNGITSTGGNMLDYTATIGNLTISGNIDNTGNTVDLSAAGVLSLDSVKGSSVTLTGTGGITTTSNIVTFNASGGTLNVTGGFSANVIENSAAVSYLADSDVMVSGGISLTASSGADVTVDAGNDVNVTGGISAISSIGDARVRVSADRDLTIGGSVLSSLENMSTNMDEATAGFAAGRAISTQMVSALNSGSGQAAIVFSGISESLHPTVTLNGDVLTSAIELMSSGVIFGSPLAFGAGMETGHTVDSVETTGAAKITSDFIAFDVDTSINVRTQSPFIQLGSACTGAGCGDSTGSDPLALLSIDNSAYTGTGLQAAELTLGDSDGGPVMRGFANDVNLQFGGDASLTNILDLTVNGVAAINATGTFTLDPDLTAGTATIMASSLTAGNITTTATDLGDGGIVEGNLSINATTSVTTGTLLSMNGDVIVSAAAPMTLSLDGAEGNNVTLSSPTITKTTTGGTLSIQATSGDVVLDGNVSVMDANVTVDALAGDVTADTFMISNGALSVSAMNEIELDSAQASTITLDAATLTTKTVGTFVDATSGNATLTGDFSATDIAAITFEASGNLDINSNVTVTNATGAADITFEAGNNTLNTLTVDGTVSVTAPANAKVEFVGANIMTNAVSVMGAGSNAAEFGDLGNNVTFMGNVTVSGSKGEIEVGGADEQNSNTAVNNVSRTAGTLTAATVAINATGTVNVVTNTPELIIGDNLGANAMTTSFTADNTAHTGPADLLVEAAYGGSIFNVGNLDVDFGGDASVMGLDVVAGALDIDAAGDLTTQNALSVQLSTGNASLSLDAGGMLTVNGDINVSVAEGSASADVSGDAGFTLNSAIDVMGASGDAVGRVGGGTGTTTISEGSRLSVISDSASALASISNLSGNINVEGGGASVSAQTMATSDDGMNDAMVKIAGNNGTVTITGDINVRSTETDAIAQVSATGGAGSISIAGKVDARSTLNDAELDIDATGGVTLTSTGMLKALSSATSGTNEAFIDIDAVTSVNLAGIVDIDATSVDDDAELSVTASGGNVNLSATSIVDIDGGDEAIARVTANTGSVTFSGTVTVDSMIDTALVDVHATNSNIILNSSVSVNSADDARAHFHATNGNVTLNSLGTVAVTSTSMEPIADDATAEFIAGMGDVTLNGTVSVMSSQIANVIVGGTDGEDAALTNNVTIGNNINAIGGQQGVFNVIALNNILTQDLAIDGDINVIAGGTLTTGTLTARGGTVTTFAGGAIDVDTITGDSVNISTTDDVMLGDVMTDAINIMANSIFTGNLTTSVGGVTLNATGTSVTTGTIMSATGVDIDAVTSIDTRAITATNGSIDLDAMTGSIMTFVLSANMGSVTGTAGADFMSLNIQARDLVELEAAEVLDIGSVNTTSSAISGDIILQAADMGSRVSNLEGLTSARNIDIDGATTSFNLTGAITANNGMVEIDGASVSQSTGADINANGNVTIGTAGSFQNITSQMGNITITAGPGTITTSLAFTASNGMVSLTAADINAGSTGSRIIAPQVDIMGTVDNTTVNIKTDADEINLNTGTGTTDFGTFTLAELDGATVNVNGTGAFGSATFSFGGDTTFNGNVISNGESVQINTTGSLAVNGNLGASSAVSLEAGGGINVTGTVQSADDANFTAGGVITAVGGVTATNLNVEATGMMPADASFRTNVSNATFDGNYEILTFDNTSRTGMTTTNVTFQDAGRQGGPVTYDSVQLFFGDNAVISGSQINAGAISMIAGGDLDFSNGFDVGPGTTNVIGDQLLVDRLAAEGINEGNGTANPNASFLSGGVLSLEVGALAQSNRYLLLVADDVLLSGTSFAPNLLVQFTPFTASNTIGLEQSTKGTQQTTYTIVDHFDHFAGTSIAIGDSTAQGNIVIGENGPVDVGDKNTIILTQGDVEGIGNCTGFCEVEQPMIMTPDNEPPPPRVDDPSTSTAGNDTVSNDPPPEKTAEGDNKDGENKDEEDKDKEGEGETTKKKEQGSDIVEVAEGGATKAGSCK